MAISTRSVAIARCAGSVVTFEARDPLGIVSVKIFLAHAARVVRRPSPDRCPAITDSVSKILCICGGLPIALAVTGCAVARLTSDLGDFEGACDAYAPRLERKRSALGDEDTVEGLSLNAGILLSLEYLEVEFVKWKAKCAVQIEHTISDLYTSLCVLEHQTWVPVSVLAVLWSLDEDATMDIVNLFCDMSLTTFRRRKPRSGFSEHAGSASRHYGELGIVLHDLQLDFCQQQARKYKSSSFWHAQLLNGYLESSRTSSVDSAAKATQSIIRCVPRQWWSEAVPEDGYIHENVARHLSCSGQRFELAALLLDARWTHARSKNWWYLGTQK